MCRVIKSAGIYHKEIILDEMISEPLKRFGVLKAFSSPETVGDRRGFGKRDRMEQVRITIKDIAEELGVSTATVSNVIHGKTKKISDQTVAKVQEKLEESGYIPNMAAVLLAQNTSKIVCVVLSDDVSYEGKMIEDPFVSGMLNYISKELDQAGYFMMLKEEPDINQIVRYASMWNMAGLILIGYCAVDYENLRERMHIPFVVVDAYRNPGKKYSDVGIDNIRGGYLAGEYLLKMGHVRILYLANSDEDCDHDRYLGLVEALEEKGVFSEKEDFKLLSPVKAERLKKYGVIYENMKDYTAAFLASDVLAVEFMNYLQEKGMRIPEDFSIIGFDDITLASCVRPALTTISQNLKERAKKAVQLLGELMDGTTEGRQEFLDLKLVERESVKQIN